MIDLERGFHFVPMVIRSTCVFAFLGLACSSTATPHDSLGSPNGGAAGAQQNLGGRAGGPNVESGEVQVVNIATWHNDATAAYSLIHDDFCLTAASGHMEHAAPELEARGLRASFAAVTTWCSAVHWDQMRALIAAGHEIVCHSSTHPHITVEDAEIELATARETLEEGLGVPITFFAFPFDDINPGVLDVARASGYLGARGGYGRNEANAADFTDPFWIDFDAFGPDTPYPNYASNPLGVLDAHLDAAVAIGGWSVREVHGVADDSWEPVPLDVYQAHLDHARVLVDAHQLWMAPPSDVVRYRFAREHCGVPSVQAGELTFGELSPECTQYATPLTVVLNVPSNPPTLDAAQAGEPLHVEKRGPGRFLVTLSPVGGAATLSLR